MTSRTTPPLRLVVTLSAELEALGVPHDTVARDRALVAYARLCAERGRPVRVLALRAPWSETHGTDYTAQHARAAGLDVRVLTYPEVP